jgi:hypothetical protein
MRRGMMKALGFAMAGPATALVLAACGGPDAARTAADVSAALEGDTTLITAAKAISDAMGGMPRRHRKSSVSRTAPS